MVAHVETYAHIHRVHSLAQATEDDLRGVIRTYPIIDNHAHNIIRQELTQGNQEHPFESITSEAQGHALLDHTHSSLAHIRGINQLADLLNCEPTLEDVKLARSDWVQRDYPSLVQKCFEGTHAIMIDDGLSPEAVYPVSWHAQFVPTASRIVRIESLAAEILEQLSYSVGLFRPGNDATWDKTQSEACLVRFNTMFRNQLRALAQDPHVRGFKSVICYRTGLDISVQSRNVFRPHQSLSESTLLSSFHTFLQKAVRTHNYRIEQKEVNDYLVVALCDVLDKLIDTDGENLPIQFHTGLGDADIDLVKANPAYMKPLITAFPNVDFVLLHASYPYTREAGYMCTTFANVWLDIGLVFPMLSREGQEIALRHALELSPTSKILWSTDGHLHPETYYLSNRQFRSALEKVLVEYTQSGDFSIPQAINFAVNIFFWNSNQLYKLDEERKYPELLRACGRVTRPDSLASSTLTSATDWRSPRAPSAFDSRPITATTTPLYTHSKFGPPDKGITMNSPIMTDNVNKFDDFLRRNTNVKYIWITTVDYTGTSRVRMIPVNAFKKHLSSGSYPRITCALPNLLPNDTQSAGSIPTGEMKMLPDMSSILLNGVIDSPSASVQAWWMEDNGSIPTDHYLSCPRWALHQQLDALQAEFGLNVLMGFEIEVIFVRPSYSEDKSDFTDFTKLNMAHSWCGVTYTDLEILPMVEEIVEALAGVGIALEQFHAEAAPGQWEFPLPAYKPIKAIDVLYKARDIIRWVAHKHGLKATLYPRPYNFTCGSASHTHFSINGSDDDVARYSDPFLAGILQHLPSILAFTLPIEESYARIGAGIWAGGEYVCWGTQNREVPLRKCGPGHWELKAIDGIGNMYLSMAALLAAGLYGLRQKLPLTIKDNLKDASMISQAEREALGITTMLPKSLPLSLESLSKDDVLRKMLGDKLVDSYVNVKHYEMKFLDEMTSEKRRRWLMARY